MNADPVLEKLRRLRPEIDWRPASDEVVEGHDLRSSGNRSHGRNVYVATHDTPPVDREALRTGRVLSPGREEAFPGCVLRFARRGALVTAALYDASGRALSRVLRAVSAADEVDEALFTWFGPLEDICTPWSDNDPPQCQVLTLEGLRAYGRKA